jgi:hypothetical protein
MNTRDINGITSLYKVDVYGGRDRTKYTLSDRQVVDIEEVVVLMHRGENIVDTLQRILNRALGPQPHGGMPPDVCIYYVKNAKSADDARDMMDAYSKNNTNYKKNESGYEVRKYINHLNLPSLPSHSKHSNLKTKSGGRRHQRRSRRGKGNGRGKKSRSSKTLRRSRR